MYDTVGGNSEKIKKTELIIFILVWVKKFSTQFDHWTKPDKNNTSYMEIQITGVRCQNFPLNFRFLDEAPAGNNNSIPITIQQHYVSLVRVYLVGVLLRCHLSCWNPNTQLLMVVIQRTKLMVDDSPIKTSKTMAVLVERR